MTEIPARAGRGLRLALRLRVGVQLGVCIAALALAPAALAGTEKFDPATARRIAVGDVKTRMDGGEKVVILDTRGVTTGAVIKGAIQVPKDQLGAIVEKLPKDALIICYCS